MIDPSKEEPADSQKELLDALTASLFDDCSPERMARLEELVCNDDLACELYVQAVFDSMVLHKWSGAETQDIALDAGCATATDQPVVATTSWGGSPHGVFGYFAEGMPLAYLVATVVIAAGLLIGSRVSITRHDTLPGESSQGAVATRESARQTVGQVTGLLHCRWANGLSAAPVGSRVAVGRKFALLSGLMEIHYDGGARVILQGPVTYEVDASDGGYLSVGKLTARVEKEEGSGKKGAASSQGAMVNTKHPNDHPPTANPQSLIPNPSFVVRTPSATVTDLGTEFGVEVTASGQVSAHVFCGRVEFCRNTGGRPAVLLGENESATTDDGSGGPAISRHAAADSPQFVRPAEFAEQVEQQRLQTLRRWQAYSRHLREDPALVAYYTFESPGADASVLPNVSALGIALDGKIDGAEWTDGRLPGKSALRFNGRGARAHVALPDPERFAFTGPYSVAVWYRVEESEPRIFETLVAKGDSAWRLQRVDASNVLVFVTTSWENEPRDAATERRLVPTSGGRFDDNLASLGDWLNVDGRWHLAVIVGEPNGSVICKRMYCDGRSMSSKKASWSRGPNDTPVWIGNNSDYPDRAFPGLIDEVAILSRAMTASEIAQMYKTGKPPSPQVETRIQQRP